MLSNGFPWDCPWVSNAFPIDMAEAVGVGKGFGYGKGTGDGIATAGNA